MSGWSELAHLLKVFSADLQSAMEKAHHAGHSTLASDAHKMAHTVDETEELVAGRVPQWDNPSNWAAGFPQVGDKGVPAFDESIHVRRGPLRADGKKPVGFHFRPGGVEDGPEHVLEHTRIDHEHGVYEADWVLLDENGDVRLNRNNRVIGKHSTFWPDHRTETDISRATAEAYMDARRFGPTSDVVVGHGGGLRVKMFLHKTHGTITSTFPYYND